MPTTMTTRVIMFTQTGCLSCELMRVFLEAHEIAFEEHDVTADAEARKTMIEEYESEETPTLVFFTGSTREIVVGFDPVRLDQLLAEIPLAGTPSSDSVTES